MVGKETAMSSVPPQSIPLSSLPPPGQQLLPPAEHVLGPEEEPDYENIVIEDGKPVDSMFAERQMKLLTEPLHTSWKPGRPFLALADVGLFFALKEPPLVPDVMVSLGVKAGNVRQKKHNSYFISVMGKPPDVVVEQVSNTPGEELGAKLAAYPRIGVPYYVVFDPLHRLGEKTLYCFVNRGGKFEPCEPWFPALGLGVKLWTGEYMGLEDEYLRWTDAHGNFIPTGEENANQERQRANHESRRANHESRRANQECQRADQESRRAEHQRQRADALAAKLKALGIDPDQP